MPIGTPGAGTLRASAGCRVGRGLETETREWVAAVGRVDVAGHVVGLHDGAAAAEEEFQVFRALHCRWPSDE